VGTGVVGRRVGIAVGTGVGFNVGVGVGNAVGIGVGVCVGASEGFNVGCIDGVIVVGTVCFCVVFGEDVAGGTGGAVVPPDTVPLASGAIAFIGFVAAV
jgi:hypothetical protein